ncbi:MAG: hypothetical protein WC292_00765 [Clostridia bacterium]
MKIFDCNVSYGFEIMPAAKKFEFVKDLIADMDKHNILKAMVYNCEGKQNLSCFSNLKLSENIKSYKDRLCAVYCFRPNIGTEMYTPAQWEQSIKDNDIKGIYFYPNDYQFDVDLLGSYFQVFNSMKLPVFVEFAAGFGFAYKIDFSALHKFLSKYTNTPFILTNAGMMNDFEIFRLSELHNNFYLELSGFQGNMALEEYVSRFGSERLLFGSRAPFFSPVPMIGKIHYSKLKASDKENICYNNMQRLVDEVNYENHQ